jgi:hypothetical protein
LRHGTPQVRTGAAAFTRPDRRSERTTLAPGDGRDGVETMGPASAVHEEHTLDAESSRATASTMVSTCLRSLTSQGTVTAVLPRAPRQISHCCDRLWVFIVSRTEPRQYLDPSRSSRTRARVWFLTAAWANGAGACSRHRSKDAHRPGDVTGKLQSAGWALGRRPVTYTGGR